MSGHNAYDREQSEKLELLKQRKKTMPNQELIPCFGCGEKVQLEVITVDRTDPSRDKIKCRHCKTSAYRQWWQKPRHASAIESAVLRRVAANSRLPHGGDRLYTAADLIAEADRIDKESDNE